MRLAGKATRWNMQRYVFEEGCRFFYFQEGQRPRCETVCVGQTGSRGGKENGICFPNGKEQLKEKSPIGTGERGIVKSESMKVATKK